MNKVEFYRTQKSPYAESYGNFIGGQWVAPVKGQYFSNITPITGKPVGEIARYLYPRAATAALARWIVYGGWSAICSAIWSGVSS